MTCHDLSCACVLECMSCTVAGPVSITVPGEHRILGNCLFSKRIFVIEDINNEGVHICSCKLDIIELYLCL